ncbi:ParB-like protein [Leptospira phage vB_LbrZ_5399-LE1]|uniref:Helix-turn-helix domain-containing protein n=1 Tax=Leptospira inadai serovar Lyme TaxID=293084 RepID=A0ABX4YGB7_9LEPT|nr:ParB N-terminal domain-containing protein [Leptospira inadai]AGS80715.1 ParB-like protein [Leptospira phage vB_LbrZ_5399-LE1]AGS80844.1 ParB-like protein [Leptospira phage vB_LinZ_10-LE1]PNV74304.1 helix-turn-helix domain-containing protein [Leptospira inadai serovar Lyme]
MLLETNSKLKIKENNIKRAVLIPLSKLKFHENNHALFQKRTESYLNLLTENIQKFGLLTPITVKEIEGGFYKILGGENRTIAVSRLNWIEIPAYIENPPSQKAETARMIYLNYDSRPRPFSERVNAYSHYCPGFFQARKYSDKSLREISKETSIPFSTLKKDLKRIRSGTVSQEITQERLIKIWEKKKILHLRVNFIDTGHGEFIIHISGKNINYEFGPDKFKTVLRQAVEAGESDHFSKEYRPENQERAKEIRDLRKRAGLTQSKMARKVELSQSYYAELETGKYRCSESQYKAIYTACIEAMDEDIEELKLKKII